MGRAKVFCSALVRAGHVPHGREGSMEKSLGGVRRGEFS